MRSILRMPGIIQMSLILITAASARAQWPTDPAANMIICDRGGEQTLAKVAATSDGGCYISWYDNSSGNYDVYLQRLNGNGEIQWAENGLLISDHPQESWITDYDLAADLDDCAILVFNDSRNGSDRDIYAYRINPAGDFVWGPDGLTISDNDGFEPDPQVTITTAGNIVLAWPEENMAHLRKVTPEGDDYWQDPSTITITTEYYMCSTRIAPAEDDGVILEIQVATGPNYWDPSHLYMHKFDDSGEALWGPDGVEVMTTGGIAPYMESDISEDGAGGAYSFWYDTRNMVHHAYAQHVEADGSVSWAINGVLLSTTADEMQMYPQLVRLPASDDILAFYRITDPNQNLAGIGGQRLDSEGQRQWGDGGITLVTVSDQDRYNLLALQQEDGAIVLFKEIPEGVLYGIIKAIRVDGSGTPVWETSPVTMVSTLSEKGRIAADANEPGQVIAAWNDKRVDSSGDIYLQNINPDGSFGSYSPSGCDYIPGDCDHNGTALELGDVIAMIGMYRGTVDPYYTCDCPPHSSEFAPEADPNGNCIAFELGDAVTEIAAYRGTDAASGCVDCPGSRR